MLTMTVFEIDLTTYQVIFPQPGLLDGFIELGRTYDNETLRDRFIREYVYAEDRNSLLNILKIEKHLHSNERTHTEFRLKHPKSGKYLWAYIHVMFSHDKNRVIGTIENIQKRKEKELRLKYQAEHDPLTGLLNRSTFKFAAEKLMSLAGARGMYAFLDVDNFKSINDSKGHGYGDYLLTKVGEKLKSILPKEALIGRFGGDEFMIYVPGVMDETEAAGLAQKIIDAILDVVSTDRKVSASVGVALFPFHALHIDNGLAECADIAMYRAKHLGKNRFCIYNPAFGNEIKYHRANQKHKSHRWSRFVTWLRGNRIYASSLLICSIILVVIMSMLTVLYTQNLQKMVENESQDYLEEISSQMNLSLVKGMTDNYAIMDSLTTKLEQNSEWSLEDILIDLTHEASIFGYRQIALIDDKGQWVTEEDISTQSQLFPYVSQLQATGKPVTTPILYLFEIECVVFLHPLKNPILRTSSIGNNEFICVAAMADMKLLNGLLNLNLFDNAGFSHVITKDGTIVIRSDHENNKFKGYNIFTYLDGARFFDGMTSKEVREDFEMEESNKIHYAIDGQDLLSVYMPVAYEDWYLFTVIPSDILNAKTSQFYSLTLFACAVIISLFFVLLVVIFMILMRGRKQLTRQLYTDPVTGGLSKLKFEIDCRNILRIEAECSIIYADISRFKLINERDGNKVGDALLKGIYTVIQRDLDEAERVARLMADHFGILVTSCNTEYLRRRILNWNDEITNMAARLNITSSVKLVYGVLPITERIRDIPQLLDKANLTKRAATGADGISVYDRALTEKLLLETELESRQEQALTNGEFAVYFQPKYSPDSNRIEGAEALVRWITPEGQTLPPDTFIPLFETNGFISKLDLYVFACTCRFIERQIEEGFKPIPISVNVSRYNLNKTDFIEDYVSIWRTFDFEASLLEFEITETLVYENMEKLGKILDRIHRYGFRVSMDDFGNGYSSLNMLKTVDIDVLKLDRGFFMQTDSKKSRAMLIVKRLIDLAKDLGMKIVAEGVENVEMVDFLRAQECDMIQGYYYCKPILEDELLNKLKEEKEQNEQI